MPELRENLLLAGTWRSVASQSRVGFSVAYAPLGTFAAHFDRHEATLAVAGPVAALTGSVDSASINVDDPCLAAQVASAQFLDSAVHPVITFESGAVSGCQERLEVAGYLTIKGHRLTVAAAGTLVGPYVDVAGRVRLDLDLTTRLDRRQFALDWNATRTTSPTALGHEVTLEVALRFLRV